MSTQIAVRLPDDMVRFVGERIGDLLPAQEEELTAAIHASFDLE